MQWTQNYDPLGNPLLSTACAALPLVVLLGAIGIFQMRIHLAALLGLGVALAVALLAFGMPVRPALAAVGYGAAYGLMPIGWIILNLIYLYQLTVKKGSFAVLREHLGSFVPDKRIQLILIAFSLGAFFEGAAGFGTPVAITAAILIQLGFKPLEASVLSLIANTAPVAFGALGTPILALSGVTGIDLHALSAMIGRQLPLFSLIVPFWVVWAYSGFRGVLGIWPAALTAGLAFSTAQFAVSNFHGPWLVDVVGAIASMAALILLLRFWQPRRLDEPAGEGRSDSESPTAATRREVVAAWAPWILLTAVIFVWGLPQVKRGLNAVSEPHFEVPYLHEVVLRGYPVAPQPSPSAPTRPEDAVYKLGWLSATGSGILVAALLAGVLMSFSVREMAKTYLETLVRVRYSLVTIAAMLALGYVTKYSGTDATLGLALAKTGVLYPFFGTLLGWLGVALTGSDTASNVLFGSLQKITAEQTGGSATLMAAANSSGGVMGKMVDAQSIVVASTATNFYGHEGQILRRVLVHSLVLASLVGLVVMLQAYVYPFTLMVVR